MTLATPLFAALFALSTPAFAEDPPTIDELLDATDDIQRGASSAATVRMEVKTKRYERTMKMRALSKGTENSLITILEPAKEAGTSTLKVGDNLWNYLPKVDRTMKVPAGMMSGNWMGSHFSNDDLVKSNRMSDSYTGEITSGPNEADESAPYVITLTPKPDAPVVWGKVIVKVTPDKLPVDIRYFDEKGTLMRTMAFSDVQEIGDKKVPMVMTLTPNDKDGEFTKITYDSLEFDVELEDRTFSLQALKR